MARNDKTSGRIDDQRKHELGGFLQGSPVPNRDDDRISEEIGDLEPGRRPLTAEHDGDGPSIDEINDRQEFARWLRPSDLPAQATTLAEAAKAEGAPGWVVDGLDSLGDRSVATIGEAYDLCAAGKGPGR